VSTDHGPALAAAIRTGDVASLQQILGANLALASLPLGGSLGSRTPLHVVADWPGYFPNGPQIVRMLIDAGADPNARSPGDETALHWAASSDDVDVASALIDGGADLESPDGSIGTPLDNAVGYGCWHVARHLVMRGAQRGQALARGSSRPAATALRNCSMLRLPPDLMRYRRPSGTPAPAVSVGRRSFY